MKDPLFCGVCTAMVTPFLNGNINYPMAEQLLRRQIDAGIRAVVVAGTTGESPTLSDAEKITLFHRCKEYVRDECLIIAGTGSNSTAHAIELSKAAENAGADALLVVSPYYNKATPDGLYIHYSAVARSVHIPVILYNVPSRTGVDIPVSVYRRLSQLPNIVGVKEASADIVKLARIRRECGDGFTIWCGNDDQVVPAMSLGAKGVISVLSNACPAEAVTMCEAALKGDYESASLLQCSLLPLIDLLFCEVNPIPVKEAMRLSGFDCGDCRLPLSRMSEDNLTRLKNYFQ